MELLQLQYFRAIATYGSMRTAAQMLFVSQPNLSIAMTRLEESLGFSLFVRKKGKLSLTKEGVQFLDCVNRILSELEGTVNEIRACVTTKEELVRVATSMNDLLGKVMESHYDEIEHLHIYQQYCDNEHIPKLVLDNHVDWGIVYGIRHAMQLNHMMIHQCPRVFVMKEGHPLLRFERLPPEALPTVKFINNRSRDEKDVLDTLGKQYHFKPNIVAECDDWALETHILNATDCVATMPLLTYLKILRSKQKYPLHFRFPDFEFAPTQTFVIYQQESVLNNYSHRLIRYVKSFLAEEDVKLQRFVATGEVEM